MIEDDKVKEVMERLDLDAQEKLILIDLLMREPKPEKETDEITGQVVWKQGMAKATDEQVSKRTRVSERVVRDRLTKLRERGFLVKKSSKGRVGNRYHVKFPKRARPATEKGAAEQPEKTQ